MCHPESMKPLVFLVKIKTQANAWDGADMLNQSFALQYQVPKQESKIYVYNTILMSNYI